MTFRGNCGFVGLEYNVGGEPLGFWGHSWWASGLCSLRNRVSKGLSWGRRCVGAARKVNEELGRNILGF